MRAIPIILIAAICIAATTTSPTTSTSQPVRLQPLVGGALRYQVPPEEAWRVNGQPGDKLVSYVKGDEKGFIEVAVDELQGSLNESFKQSYTLRMGKAIRDQAKAENSQLVYGPRAEKDDRFWLVMRDKRKTTGGDVVDRMQLFRTFGIYIVRVAVTSIANPENETYATEVHDVGIELLDKMKVMRGVKPTYFPRSQLKITPPVDWKEIKTDKPNDVVVTYVDESNPSSKIIVRARVMPKEARTPGPKQEALVNKMLDDERLTAPFSRENPSRDEQAESDDKALKRTRSSGAEKGNPISITTRYFIVSDMLVSVRAISDPGDAAAVGDIAQKLAVAPIRE